MLAGHMLCDWIELDWVPAQSAAEELSAASQIESTVFRRARPREYDGIERF
jgi:hypothetical protein